MEEKEEKTKEWTLREALGAKIGTNKAVEVIKKSIENKTIKSTSDAIKEWEKLTGLDARIHLSAHEHACITVKKS